MTLAVMIASSMWLQTDSARAHNNASAHITITPAVCVIDIIQDGNHSTVQTSSPDCETALPVLLPNLPTQVRPLSPLFGLLNLPREPSPPFGQSKLPRPQVEGTSTPVTRIQSQSSVESDRTHLLNLIGGAVLMLAIVAWSMDAALFELRYSKCAMRWGSQPEQ